MNWAVSTYLTALALLSIFGVIEERRLKLELWHSAMSVSAALVLIIGVVGYYNEQVGYVLGKPYLLIVILSGLWSWYGTKRYLKAVLPFPDMSEKENNGIVVSAVVFSIVFLAPAYFLSSIVGIRAW
jgi:hypothetical protein